MRESQVEQSHQGYYPAIMPGAIYTQQQILNNLRIGPNTITVWLNAGLRSYKPATKARFFNGSDIIEFFERNLKLSHPRSAKERAERRKRRE